MSIQTEFILPATVIRVTHEATVGDPGRTGEGVVVAEANVEPDTLTTIEVHSQGVVKRIYLLWRPPSWRPILSVLHVEETATLFVGGGTVSVIIDVREMRVISQQEVCLFWSFQHTTNSILELGELECVLYKTNGECVRRVPVDPPYEVIESEHEVEFVSSLYGTHRIAYPVA